MLAHYLSPAGSIDRKTFAASTARVVAASLVLGIPLFLGFRASSQANHLPAMFATGIGLMVVLIGSGWSCLALQIQRLHHQGYSARSAIIMTLAGLAVAPMLKGIGLAEGVGTVLSAALGLGYLMWLALHRGPAEPGSRATRPPPMPEAGGDEPAARPDAG